MLKARRTKSSRPEEPNSGLKGPKPARRAQSWSRQLKAGAWRAPKLIVFHIWQVSWSKSERSSCQKPLAVVTPGKVSKSDYDMRITSWGTSATTMTFKMMMMTRCMYGALLIAPIHWFLRSLRFDLVWSFDFDMRITSTMSRMVKIMNFEDDD